MKKTVFFLLTLATFYLLSCSTAALKREEIPGWLLRISSKEAPAINVTGKWYDANGNSVFGWGEGYMQQKQDHVDGAIGNYLLEGHVTGKKVYLVFLSGGKVYYTARLDMFDDGSLRGSYFNANDKEQINGYPTTLARKKD